MARKTKHDEMRSHYDFSDGVRGKHAARYAEGTNVVVLAPHLVTVFADSIAVNEALRTLVRMWTKRSESKLRRRNVSVDKIVDYLKLVGWLSPGVTAAADKAINDGSERCGEITEEVLLF